VQEVFALVKRRVWSILTLLHHLSFWLGQHQQSKVKKMLFPSVPSTYEPAYALAPTLLDVLGYSQLYFTPFGGWIDQDYAVCNSLSDSIGAKSRRASGAGRLLTRTFNYIQTSST